LLVCESALAHRASSRLRGFFSIAVVRVAGCRSIKVRFTWDKRNLDEPRWEQAFSADGGSTWETNWVMRFRLHRNFQGYSTQPDCDLIGLGVSAIGRVGATYSQNVKTLDEYYDCINQGHLPVVRGLALTKDDLVRRAVIMALMCQGELLFEPLEQSWLIDFRSYFDAELQQLQEMAAQGLVKISDEGVEVTPMGWYFVRGVAMVFDKYLQADRNRARFSRII